MKALVAKIVSAIQAHPLRFVGGSFLVGAVLGFLV